MLRHILSLGFRLTFGVLMFLQPLQSHAQVQAPHIDNQLQPGVKPNLQNLDKALQPVQVPQLPPKVQIVGIELVVGAECSTNPDIDCARVKWRLHPPPSDLTGLIFEVTGKMTYESGNSTNTPNPAIDVKQGSALVSFVHTGSGLTKSVTLTLKVLSTNSPSKQLVSEHTLTKNF